MSTLCKCNRPTLQESGEYVAAARNGMIETTVAVGNRRWFYPQFSGHGVKFVARHKPGVVVSIDG
jgi:hypothetical protein